MLKTIKIKKEIYDKLIEIQNWFIKNYDVKPTLISIIHAGNNKLLQKLRENA